MLRGFSSPIINTIFIGFKYSHLITNCSALFSSSYSKTQLWEIVSKNKQIATIILRYIKRITKMLEFLVREQISIEVTSGFVSNVRQFCMVKHPLLSQTLSLFIEMYTCSNPVVNPPVCKLDWAVRNAFSHSQTLQVPCELVNLFNFYPFNHLKGWEVPFKETTICMNRHNTR